MKTEVRFDSGGLGLAGHLFAPDASFGERRPAIVVGHPGSGVKEQAAGLCARCLAERGFVTLAFDAAHQGASEGLPRGLEDPAQRIEDIKAAVSFLSTLNSVHPEGIGVLGLCASGGYSVPATAGDQRIKALATVSCADVGRQFRYGADGTQPPAVIQTMLDAAAAARTAAAKGAEMASFPLFPSGEQEARAGGQHVFEGWEYYCTERGQHPRSAKSFTWSSVDRLATFEAFKFIDMIAPRPLLMIAGRRAVTSWMTSEAFVAAREPKEVMWMDGASHVDLYDKEAFVGPAVARLAEFFGQRLPA